MNQIINITARRQIMLGVLKTRFNFLFILTCVLLGGLSVLVAKEPQRVGVECCLEDLDLRKDKKNEFHTIAKFFGSRFYGSQSCAVTNVIISMTNKSGIMCHVAWYADAYILTFMNGPEEGKQVIYLNDKLFDTSFPVEKFRGGATHEYSWGTVLTLYQNQEVCFTSKAG